MGRRRLPPLPRSVTTLAARLAKWRKGQPRNGRLPDWAWAEAVDAALSHGVHRISQAVRINYYSLKRRVLAEENQRSPEKQPETKPVFVELEVGRPLRGGCVRAVLQLEDAEGKKLSIHAESTSAADLATLSRALWRER